MSLSALGTRIKNLASAFEASIASHTGLLKQVETSLTNHNALAGRLAEAQEILGFLQNIPGPIGEAAKAVDTGITAVAPAVEQVISDVGSIIDPATTTTKAS